MTGVPNVLSGKKPSVSFQFYLLSGARILCLGILACLTFSCVENESPEKRILAEFKRKIQIGELKESAYESLDNAYGMVSDGRFIATFGESSGGQQVCLSADSSDESGCRFVNKGRASGESSHVSGVQLYRDSVFVSVDPYSVWAFGVRDLLGGTIIPARTYVMETLAQSIVRVMDGGFLYVRRNTSDPDNGTLYKLQKADGEQICFGAFEPMEITFPSDDESKHTAWQGKMASTPDMRAAVHCFSYGAGFDIIDVETQSIIRRLWETPQVSMRSIPEYRLNLVEAVAGYKNFFRDCTLSDRYLYILTNVVDEDIQYVLRYDLAGRPVDCFILPRNAAVSRIAVADSDGKIFFLQEGVQSNRILQYAF